MKVIVQENRRAPVVVTQVWYKVGGSYERDGITGVSHVLEHMMFKGTEEVPAGKFSEIIAAHGGKENAFTSKDYTAYFQRISNDHLELCLELEADRMKNLLLEEDEFLKEIEVVKEERRLRTDDKPTALTYERFNATAFVNNPYRKPIIGWMEDLDTMEIDDLREWYQAWYAPNNATLVVVGDVRAAEVFSLAKKHFGPLRPADVPTLKPRREVEQHGIKRVAVKAPARVPYLVMGYKVPVLKTAEQKDDVYALELLSGLLDGGNSSRFSKNLIRGSQIATSVGSSYSLYSLHDSLFTISAIPSNGASIDQLETAIIGQIKALQQEPPSQQELDRVKAQVVAASVFEQDSSFYQAMKIGIMETVGLGWETKDEYVERINAVTAEEVQQVARKYFVEDQLTVAELVPQSNELQASIENDVTSGAGDANE
ncbi:MAG: insulinase family protein [Thiotrichales bacterium]|nr:MAG: insulinase family protein [Thiotrichales bacterium]